MKGSRVMNIIAWGAYAAALIGSGRVLDWARAPTWVYVPVLVALSFVFLILKAMLASVQLERRK